MSIKKLLISILKLLFILRCRHRYVEHNRKTFSFKYNSYDALPVERVTIIELKCVKCGNIKIVRYKV